MALLELVVVVIAMLEDAVAVQIPHFSRKVCEVLLGLCVVSKGCLALNPFNTAALNAL